MKKWLEEESISGAVGLCGRWWENRSSDHDGKVSCFN